MDALEEVERLVNADEKDLAEALGMAELKEEDFESSPNNKEDPMTEELYNVMPDPLSERADLSGIRGKKVQGGEEEPENNGSDTELAALAEILPEVTKRRMTNESGSPSKKQPPQPAQADEEGDRVAEPATPAAAALLKQDEDEDANSSGAARRLSMEMCHQDSMKNQSAHSWNQASAAGEQHQRKASSPAVIEEELEDGDQGDDTSFGDYPGGSENNQGEEGIERKIPKEFVNMSSGNSISTATQTHEVRMPMYLPTFKPATGCTNASDFVVRCFVARLRSGITVVKHGRSRWCKSRLRVLHIHADGRSLSWKPAEGEPNSSKRPPKLDLSTCLEVRHAWSPDPQNPMYTGTPILRQKCEAANAHKSFALIFKQRTVDITAVTADQCKVLMEGFSALCFRLQVANLAGGRNGAGGAGSKRQARPMPEEDGVSTTASATLTNTSTPRNR